MKSPALLSAPSVECERISATATLTIFTAAPHDRSTTSAGLGKFGWLR